VSHAFFQLAREFDRASQAGGRGVMLRSRNRALAVYGLQVLLAIIAAPSDIAKLAGADVMVQAFQPFGLGGVCSPCETAASVVAARRCRGRS
jgi:hypothetical protein